MRHRRTTNENKMLSKMENMISMMATEKPFERLQSLEQKINEMDKIQTIENYIAQLKERIWAVKEVLTTAEASAYLGLSESYIYKLTSLKQIPHYKPNGKLVYFNRKELCEWAMRNQVQTIGQPAAINKRRIMNRKEIDLLLSRIEGLKSFLENNSLENFQQEILNVENYLKRFGSLAELLSHLENVEKIAYAAKEFLNIDEVAAYLQVSKGYVYKLTMQKELTVYKPNGKNIFILRDDLNRWIKRNPCFSNTEIERQANVIAYTLGQKSKNKPTKGGKK